MIALTLGVFGLLPVRTINVICVFYIPFPRGNCVCVVHYNF